MSPREITPGLLSWAPDLDRNAEEQAIRTARLPFLAGHVALMPDAHWGMGATVGSVIPTRGAIVPAAVGVDIGCGMNAARLNAADTFDAVTSAHLPDDLGPLHAMIAAAVPAGLGKAHERAHDSASVLDRLPEGGAWESYGPELERTAHRQLGTLGSGNHFVEVCLDEQDRVWIVLHSGSRGVGNKLAKIHIDIAKGLMRDWFINLPDPDLAYLIEDTPEFDAYIADMLWAQDYAVTNRDLMMRAIVRSVGEFLGHRVVPGESVDCHHNFTAREHHAGWDVLLTRKGAIRARVGDRGVIPGSMGTRSYIVSGLGNTASYCSCSHGAGRRLGRKQAERELTYESLVSAMEGKTWNEDRALLDEHPAAYKPIEDVMAAQADLVTIEHTLHQILNYKGTS
jgi:tRNA-splicing ligase RtcB